MQNDLEILRSILGGFFKEQFYPDGIEKLRDALVERKYYKDSWEGIVRLILMKDIPEGKALYFMDNDANLPLHENSDDEAFKWLTLMVINASKPKGDKIFDYKKFLDPDAIKPIA